jgi:hypothetical protein
MTRKELEELRRAFGNYVRSEGCGCCRDQDSHEDAAKEMGRLLRVPKYKDGSGYDFYQFATEEKS